MKLLSEFKFNNDDNTNTKPYSCSNNGIFIEIARIMRVEQFQHEPLPALNGSILGTECVGNIIKNKTIDDKLYFKLYKNSKLVQYGKIIKDKIEDLNIDIYCPKTISYRLCVFKLQEKRLKHKKRKMRSLTGKRKETKRNGQEISFR